MLMSSHQSRHSFGTFLISEGIPIESIAKMMGHSGIRTTQRYAEVTDKKISKDMDNPDGGQNDVRNGQMVQKTRTAKRNKH